MNSLLFLSIFSALGIIYFILGLIASKNIKTTADYFLAGRNLGLIPVTFTLIATQVGGGMLLGTAQEAYNIGYFGILYTIGMSLGFLLLGLGFAARLQSLNVVTTAELFETRYHAPALKKIASLLSIATMGGILIAQFIASRALLNGLEINNEIVFILFWLGIIIYTMVGGLKAVVITDVAQLIFIVFIFGGIFIYSLLTEPCSFFSCSSMMAHQTLFDISGISFSQMLGIIMMPALFSLIEQDLAQRFFASRTKQIAALSAICSSIFLLLFSLVPIYLGIKAKLLGLDIPLGTSPLIPVLGLITNSFVLSLAVCGIVAAITSTADSLLCAISSNIAQDFDFSSWGITNKLKLSQWVTLFTGAICLVVSYFAPQNIISIMISSYELSVSCLTIPLVISYFYTNLNKNAAIGAIVGGLIGFIGFRLYPLSISTELITLGLSGIGYFIGNKFKKPLY